MPVQAGLGLERAPDTYDEWLSSFSYLREHTGDRASLHLLRHGRLLDDSGIRERFLVRLDTTVREALNCRISIFLDKIEELFDAGDFDGVEIAAMRFCGDLDAWFFFEDLLFIPEEKRDEFVEGFSSQLDSFWRRFIHTLQLDAEEHRNDELEELVYRLSRINGIWRKGATL